MAEQILCKCCTPPKPLVPKMDMGQNDKGQAKVSICIFHKPKSVYVLKDDGSDYELHNELETRGGQIVKKETGETFGEYQASPNLIEQEESSQTRTSDKPQQGGSAPQTGTRVNLEQDEYYDSRKI